MSKSSLCFRRRSGRLLPSIDFVALLLQHVLLFPSSFHFSSVLHLFKVPALAQKLQEILISFLVIQKSG
jgi:hypothetical protein